MCNVQRLPYCLGHKIGQKIEVLNKTPNCVSQLNRVGKHEAHLLPQTNWCPKQRPDSECLKLKTDI